VNKAFVPRKDDEIIDKGFALSSAEEDEID
jgi:hypothetical protein